jgi:hypothetical protein
MLLNIPPNSIVKIDKMIKVMIYAGIEARNNLMRKTTIVPKGILIPTMTV